MRPTALCFFFNDTATTEIYTLSLHDALPISSSPQMGLFTDGRLVFMLERKNIEGRPAQDIADDLTARSEEHTSELQSQSNLVCRPLLDKKTTADLQSDDVGFEGPNPLVELLG